MSPLAFKSKSRNDDISLYRRRSLVLVVIVWTNKVYMIPIRLWVQTLYSIYLFFLQFQQLALQHNICKQCEEDSWWSGMLAKWQARHTMQKFKKIVVCSLLFTHLQIFSSLVHIPVFSNFFMLNNFGFLKFYQTCIKLLVHNNLILFLSSTDFLILFFLNEKRLHEKKYQRIISDLYFHQIVTQFTYFPE